MLITRCLPLLMLGCLAGPALAGEGLKLGTASEYWPGLQTDIKLNAAWVAASPFGLAGLASESGRAPLGISLLGDYYFSKDPTPGQPRSGFRASSGLMMYQGGISAAQVAWASRSAATFGMTSRISLAAVPQQSLNPAAGSFSALPYVGVGYSGIYPKSSWGFWAPTSAWSRRARALCSASDGWPPAGRAWTAWCTCACRRWCSWASTIRSDARRPPT